MKVLVTGSAGHLGEALIRTLMSTNHEVIGVDIVHSDFTSKAGSITDRDHVRRCMSGVDAVVHAATLHKPHLITHSRQSFVDTNITGTLILLEEAVSAGVGTFVFTTRPALSVVRLHRLRMLRRRGLPRMSRLFPKTSMV